MMTHSPLAICTALITAFAALAGCQRLDETTQPAKPTRHDTKPVLDCADARIDVAQNLIATVVASEMSHYASPNEGTRLRARADDYGMMLELPFEPLAEGEFVMDVGTDTASTCAFTVQRPDETTPIADANPFMLDSYVHVTDVISTVPMQELIDDPLQKTTLHIFWDEPGPLFDVLDVDGALPNPFSVRLSLADLALVSHGFPYEGEMDLGPLRGLLDLSVASNVDVGIRPSS